VVEINLFSITRITISGITIVISPLIALMKDQVDGLKANGIEACFHQAVKPKTKDNFI
jgi:ATP-dependent DNA helicase RecQ